MKKKVKTRRQSTARKYRAVDYYRSRGYDDNWIKARMTGVVDRRKLTDECYGLEENKKVAKMGGHAAKVARDDIEKNLGESVVTKNNALNYKYVDDEKLIEEKNQ